MGGNNSRVQAANGQVTYEMKMQEQMMQEAMILANDTTCQAALNGGTSEKNPQELADQVNQFYLKYALDERFYDAELMRAISCILKVGLTTDNQLTAATYVRDFFTNSKQIGAPSVEGIAMMTGVKANPNMFVIKAPKNPKFDGLIHEYFIGVGGYVPNNQGGMQVIIGTNWLRRLCLNYAQILGGFRCGPPIVDSMTKEVKSMCSATDPNGYVSHIIYEKIDGDDMSKMAATITAPEFITTMIQLSYALEIGQTFNGFTHYDMHHQNVILRKVPGGEEALVPFVLTDSNTVYVKSAYIPTMIDYGRSHIQYPPPAAEVSGYPTLHFGFWSSLSQTSGLLYDHARPYYDIYKFLGFSLMSMAQASNPAFEQCWQLMQFFGMRTRDDVIYWINTQIKEYFNASQPFEKMGFCLAQRDQQGAFVCVAEKASTMYDFLEFIEVAFPAVWQERVFKNPIAGAKVLRCGVECNDFAGSIENLTSNVSANNLTSLKDFKDIVRFRNNFLARGNYFSENFPQSTYGSKVIADVERLDTEIVEGFDEVNNNYAQQILAKADAVVDAYNAIGYPLQYPAVASGNPEEIARFLYQVGGYLDRMQAFAQVYAEFKEYYEAGADITRISGNQPSAELEEYVSRHVTPVFEAYDNSKGEIRSILTSTPVPEAYVSYKQTQILRTQ